MYIDVEHNKFMSLIKIREYQRQRIESIIIGGEKIRMITPRTFA